MISHFIPFGMELWIRAKALLNFSCYEKLCMYDVMLVMRNKLTAQYIGFQGNGLRWD